MNNFFSILINSIVFPPLPPTTDNRALPINRKQKVFPNGTLIIENVERNSDQATYTCVAKNAEGYSARGALEVQVMGKCSSVHHQIPSQFTNIED